MKTEKKKLIREELLFKLKELKKLTDLEDSHLQADEALLDYIDDPEVRKAFGALDK